jgi:hypothetical protein
VQAQAAAQERALRKQVQEQAAAREQVLHKQARARVLRIQVPPQGAVQRAGGVYGRIRRRTCFLPADARHIQDRISYVILLYPFGCSNTSDS